MATLVLSTLGTVVGGPIGSAVGAIIGQQIDAQIFGSGRREGPRLKELSVTTSSYGTPIPRHFGKVRAAGSIIWSTDLIESKESSGGGKGKPKTTTYSYSSSFAVALSSRPITGIGRIWADGNLLRGAAGDLKTGGAMRIYTGEGDQSVDPLLQAAEGSNCPAFRGTAYAVFEDLQLEDFGNRIPALTFEVFADDAVKLHAIASPHVRTTATEAVLQGLTGISYEGGALGAQLELVDQLFPLRADLSDDDLLLELTEHDSAEAQLLPAPAAWDEADFGQRDGKALERNGEPHASLTGLRYYDTDRDYQPGVQRVAQRTAGGPDAILQFPGSFAAHNASALLGAAALRQHGARETLRWRVVELSNALLAGNIVKAPGYSGMWEIAGWEWREKGAELELRRTAPKAIAASPSDSGAPAVPPDSLPSETLLSAFELPWDGNGSPDNGTIYVAASSSTPAWRGASLFVDTATGLQPVGQTGRSQSVMGTLTTELLPSHSLLLEQSAWIEVATASEDHVFASTSADGLASGQNRLLVGEEIVQFGNAEQISESVWRLSSLLRGRGGTELSALQRHSVGTPVIAIGENLVPVDRASLPGSDLANLAAIGLADDEPVSAAVLNRGISTKPLSPVHARADWQTDGSLHLCWTRRARGGWAWRDGIELPLVEETELYRIGVGASDSVGVWETSGPAILLQADDLSPHLGKDIWVKQVGRHSQSDALHLVTLP